MISSRIFFQCRQNIGYPRFRICAVTGIWPGILLGHHPRCCGVPGFGSSLGSQSQHPASAHPGRQQVMALILVCLLWLWKTQVELLAYVSGLPSHGFCRHLGGGPASGPANGPGCSPFSLPPSLFLLLPSLISLLLAPTPAVCVWDNSKFKQIS